MVAETFFCVLVFFFGGTGVGTHGFELAEQVLYHLSHTSSPFLFWLLWRLGFGGSFA
jgi:hypothetical protein